MGADLQADDERDESTRLTQGDAQNYAVRSASPERRTTEAGGKPWPFLLRGSTGSTGRILASARAVMDSEVKPLAPILATTKDGMNPDRISP